MTDYTHEWAVTVDGVSLSVVSGELTIDESWAPYAQCNIVCAIPAVMPDPRSGQRAVVTMTRTSSTGNVQTRTANLGIRKATPNRIAGEVRLELASDEALVQDYALAATEPNTISAGTGQPLPVSTLVRAVLVFHPGYLQGPTWSSLITSADGYVDETAATWDPGRSAWAFIIPPVQKAGLRLWCDLDRTWHLDLALPTLAESVNLDYRSEIVGTPDEEIARDDEWCDAVVVEYRWVDEDKQQQQKWDIASALPYSPTSWLRGTRMRVFTYEVRYPGPGAAQKLLDRNNKRGRTLTLTAVADLKPTPGMACTITAEDIPVQQGRVSAVTWRYPDDEMTVRTRDLTNL